MSWNNHKAKTVVPIKRKSNEFTVKIYVIMSWVNIFSKMKYIYCRENQWDKPNCRENQIRQTKLFSLKHLSTFLPTQNSPLFEDELFPKPYSFTR